MTSDPMTSNTTHESACRSCATPLDFIFADLGSQPIANDFVVKPGDRGHEPRYPLRVACCRLCRLVQIVDTLPSDRLFRADYVYQSSISSSFVAHARTHVEELIETYRLGPTHHIVEIASNDGYLLQFFKDRNIPVTGIEPSASVAKIARDRHGIPTIERFFGAQEALRLKDEIGQADIILANNVLAHVPDLFDFLTGVKSLLKTDGVARLEFPHLLSLLDHVQFDTIYHEHYSYLSLLALQPLLERVGLQPIDCEEIAVHGGSLRLSLSHSTPSRTPTERLLDIMRKERDQGLDRDEPYLAFGDAIRTTCAELRAILQQEKSCGALIAAYGAPAKGNTLLNTAGIDGRLISFTVDRAASKRGKYLPGSGIPVLDPSMIEIMRPDLILILPWNIKDEIMAEFAHMQISKTRFLIATPRPEIISSPVHERKQAS